MGDEPALVDGIAMESAASAGEDFRLRNGVGKGIGGALEFGAFVAIRIGDGEKKAAESGATHLVLGREIGTAKKRFAVGKQEACERPATLSGNGANGRLVARINVGALVAVDFHGDEMLVDDFRELGV